MVKTNTMRVDPDFEMMIENIKIERIKNGRDRLMRSSPRITKAFTRTADFTKMQKEIINADFKEE